MDVVEVVIVTALVAVVALICALYWAYKSDKLFQHALSLENTILYQLAITKIVYEIDVEKITDFKATLEDSDTVSKKDIITFFNRFEDIDLDEDSIVKRIRTAFEDYCENGVD